MKKLLITTAMLEAPTGVLLMIVPKLTTSLLLGAKVLDPITSTIVRITGAAIITLALACWFLRENENDKNIVKALLFYNIAVTSILIHSKFAFDLEGIGLFPTIIGHFLLFVWCIVAIQRTNSTQSQA